MRLTKLSSSLVPLTLAAGMTMPSFSYSDADAHSGIRSTTNNHRIFEYISSVDENEASLISEKLRFQYLYESWRAQTKFMSSPESIITNSNFQSIVKMGRSAVPLILDEISAEPSTLVWALNIIYKHKISDNPKTTIPEACRLWLNLFKK